MSVSIKSSYWKDLDTVPHHFSSILISCSIIDLGEGPEEEKSGRRTSVPVPLPLFYLFNLFPCLKTKRNFLNKKYVVDMCDQSAATLSRWRQSSGSPRPIPPNPASILKS